MNEKLLNINDAAAVLIMSPETLRRKTKAGDVPAIKTGKGWAFHYVDLIKYVRSQYKVPDNFYIDDTNQGSITKNDSSKRVITYPAQRKIDKEYAQLLKKH